MTHCISSIRTPGVISQWGPGHWGSFLGGGSIFFWGGVLLINPPRGPKVCEKIGKICLKLTKIDHKLVKTCTRYRLIIRCFDCVPHLQYSEGLTQRLRYLTVGNVPLRKGFRHLAYRPRLAQFLRNSPEICVFIVRADFPFWLR